MVERSPVPELFRVCHGYGCAWRSKAALSQADWQAIRQVFDAPAPTPREERGQIARAIGLIEQAVGRQIGTAADLGRTQFRFSDDPTQLDCVDEAVNASTYLQLLDRACLIQLHRVHELRRRTRFLFLGQHYTAVVEERDSGRQYAVDSWFHANGNAAEVVELDRWLAGWEPPSR
jgi:hypothetical protein